MPKSALRRKRAKNNWMRLVTVMRSVDIADCEGMFVKDEYRKVKIGEDDLDAIVNGEFVLKEIETEEEDTPSKKRVTWRAALEEKREDVRDKFRKEDCKIVDISSATG